ncbi:MAG: glyceraldehyde-3-phosphate:ferredoxin oxidoreductase [Caldisphaeraceae archaeon]|nr:glyceraldehyde-3-phosphate:ferredoxin oxidoreductase [Caldisphaeraceae archaeon]
MRLKYLDLDVEGGSFEIKEVDSEEVYGIIDFGLKMHYDKRTYDLDPLDPGNLMVLGIGPFAGGIVIGSHRIVFIFKSPISMGLHVSELGGAGYAFYKTGLDAMVIRGRSTQPSIIKVFSGSDGGHDITIEHLDERELWEIYKGYGTYKGTRALTQHVISKEKDKIIRNKARVLVVGPGSFKTRFGGIFSYVLDERTAEITPVSDSASRGGGGSVLARAHNVVAIVVGGQAKKDNAKIMDIKVMNQISQEVYKGSYTSTLLERTVKYRFDPKTKTGGTFGVNYIHYKDLVPSIAYNTIYYSRSVRLMLHDKIIESYWKPFEDEVFNGGKLTSASKNCGEPCPVSCKKIYKGTKIDYEPAHGVGPINGVITIDDSARLVTLLDDMGLDAIETGHITSWLFDLLQKGLLDLKDLGLEKNPTLDPEEISVETSKVNAEVLEKIIYGMVYNDENNTILRSIAEKGARQAAKELTKIYEDRVRNKKRRFEDLLVYAPFGKEGYMTPNYYWSPGVLAPLYILGKYWTDYSPSFKEPEDYASISIKRAASEYIVSNAGFCRFHRGWAEEMISRMYKSIFGVEVDPLKHGLKMYKAIAEYQLKSGAEPVFWESRKVIDIIASIAAEAGTPNWEDAMYHIEKMREWWSRFYKKVKDTIDSL